MTGKQLAALFFLLSFLVLTPWSSGFAGKTKKIFIVHSYKKNHVCGQPQHDGVVKGMALSGWRTGQNLEIEAFYMETKQKNNTPERMQIQAQKALKAISRFRPDVLVILDDNAFRTVALPLAKEPLPIVFSGMNGQPETYNQTAVFMKNRKHPGYNITGIYEKLHIQESIKVMTNMLALKKVLILDDLSPTGRAISTQVTLELASFRNDVSLLPCKVQSKTVNSWEGFKKTIARINADPDIGAFYLGSLLLRDAAGKTHTAPDIIDYVINQAEKPAIGPNYAFIKMGLFGGASVNFFAMGVQAGKKAAAVLNGKDPGSLPIDDARDIALVFNLARAETLGIDIPKDVLLSADEVYKK